MMSCRGHRPVEQHAYSQHRNAAASIRFGAGVWRRPAVLVHAGGEPSHPVKMAFKIYKPVSYGLHLVLTGSDAALGSWDHKQGAKMAWTEGHNWIATLELPAGTRVEFKCLTRSKTGELGEWQQGPNMVITPPHEASACDVKFGWDGRHSLAITAPFTPPRPPAPSPSPNPTPQAREPSPAPMAHAAMQPAAATPPQTVAPPTSPPSSDSTIQLPPDPLPMQSAPEANTLPAGSREAAVAFNAAILDSVGAGGTTQPHGGAVKDDMLLLDSTAPPPPDTVSSRQSWDAEDSPMPAAESARGTTSGSNGSAHSNGRTGDGGVHQTREGTPPRQLTGTSASSSNDGGVSGSSPAADNSSSYAAPAWRMRTARGQNNVVARGSSPNMFSTSASNTEDPAAIIARGGQAVLESPHAARAGDATDAGQGLLGLKGYELAAHVVKRAPRMRKVVLAPDGAARSALAGLTVAELRSECKKRCLPCSGARSDLLLRLMDAGLDW